MLIDNKAKIYTITATEEVNRADSREQADTFQELVFDYHLVDDRMNDYNEVLSSGDYNIISDKYTEPGGFTSTIFSDLTDKRFFMVMAQVFNNRSNFNTFKSAIITNELDKIKAEESKTNSSITN